MGHLLWRGAGIRSTVVVVEHAAVDEAQEPECGDGEGGEFVWDPTPSILVHPGPTSRTAPRQQPVDYRLPE
jgi:hypothetical protein